MNFEIESSDPSTRARAGELRLSHGSVPTPVFMPVGTQGTVKTLTPAEVQAAGSHLILGNTYHLFLRPGADVIQSAGGLHRFASWPHAILTDSGGYQIFSLKSLRKINQEGVVFQSHLDGSYHMFTPESVVQTQRALGSDIMMVLDECPPYPSTEGYVAASNALTLDWARRSMEAFRSTAPLYGYEQALFAIVQGGTYPHLRGESATALLQFDFPGYAIGGISVGEPKSALREMVELCTELLPQAKPRYLMGVGKPDDVVHGIAMGIDMFDCVIPTRNGRRGEVFTKSGPLHLRNACFKEDFRPIDESCACYGCQSFSRAYLRHLFQANEILGMRLGSLHNLFFYQSLVSEARQSILAGEYESWQKDFLREYGNAAEVEYTERREE